MRLIGVTITIIITASMVGIAFIIMQHADKYSREKCTKMGERIGMVTEYDGQIGCYHAGENGLVILYPARRGSTTAVMPMPMPMPIGR